MSFYLFFFCAAVKNNPLKCATTNKTDFTFITWLFSRLSHSLFSRAFLIIIYYFVGEMRG